MPPFVGTRLVGLYAKRGILFLRLLASDRYKSRKGVVRTLRDRTPRLPLLENRRQGTMLDSDSSWRLSAITVQRVGLDPQRLSSSRFFYQKIRSLPCKRSILLAALQQEIRRHDFSHFVDEPPSVAQGGKGVVVPGCPACKKRIATMPQFLDHLTDDVLPPLLDRLSQAG